MTNTNTQTIHLHVDKLSGCFSLLSSIHLLDCEPWVSGRDESGRPFTFAIRMDATKTATRKINQGKESLSFQGTDPTTSLFWEIEFNWPPDQRMLIWRLTMRNESNQPLFLERLGLLRPTDKAVGNLAFPAAASPRERAIFCNGWQSWSYSAAYRGNQRMHRSRLGILQEPMVLNPDTPLPRVAGSFGSDFFTVLADSRQRVGLLLGFLSQREHFGSICAHLRGSPAVSMYANGDGTRLESGASLSTDWAVILPISLDQPDPLGTYLEAVAHEHGLGALPTAPAGWCSWYQYYQKISEEIIRANLKCMQALRHTLPLDLLQIDDGFQEHVGDWLTFRESFPDGVAGLAREIKSQGFTPGLWLAPFILHPASRLAREHPDWLLRQADSRPVRAGFAWNSLAVALDLTVPAALDYACQVVHTAARQWGYPYLKLDFLYAAALKGRYRDPNRTRAQVLRTGMRALREASGKDVFLLGCGAPLGSVLGLVDGMRIGADVSPSWRPAFNGISLPFRSEPHMPSVRNAIQNAITRAPLHNRWWINDPDCLLVRSEAKLTLAEIQSLATVIALTGGSLLLSDDLSILTPDRQRLASCLLPLIGQRARVMDWMDSQTPARLRLDLENQTGRWTILAAFNWSDSPSDIIIRPADYDLLADRDYHTRSFWEGQLRIVRAGQPLYSGRLAPHGSALVAVRAVQPDLPLYLGSDLHISQGLEVAGWVSQANEVTAALDVRRMVEGNLDIFLPYDLWRVDLDGAPLPFTMLTEGCWRIRVKINNRAILRLNKN